MQIFGVTESTRIVDGNIINEWRIPAQSEGLARRQARANARIKHGRRGEVEGIERVGSGRIPGQKIYLVEVSTQR